MMYDLNKVVHLEGVWGKAEALQSSDEWVNQCGSIHCFVLCSGRVPKAAMFDGYLRQPIFFKAFE